MFRKKHFYGAVSGTKNKKNRLSIIILTIIMVFVSIELAQAVWREYQINKKISSLKDEITRYDKENNDLEKMLDYYNTLSYKEKEARLKLNLQKPGEKTILVDSAEETVVETEIDITDDKNNKDSSNIKKWWDYFFKKKN